MMASRFLIFVYIKQWFICFLLKRNVIKRKYYDESVDNWIECKIVNNFRDFDFD